RRVEPRRPAPSPAGRRLRRCAASRAPVPTASRPRFPTRRDGEPPRRIRRLHGSRPATPRTGRRRGPPASRSRPAEVLPPHRSPAPPPPPPRRGRRHRARSTGRARRQGSQLLPGHVAIVERDLPAALELLALLVALARDHHRVALPRPPEGDRDRPSAVPPDHDLGRGVIGAAHPALPAAR